VTPRRAAIVLAIAALAGGCTGASGTPDATRAGTTRTPSVPGPSGLVPASPLLPGLDTGPPPWPPERRFLGERLANIGLPRLGREVTRIHFHLDLVVFVHSVPVRVPFGIGFAGDRLAEIHTHAGRGTIHVEASHPQDFTLGMVFDVWGVRFTPTCLGGLCSSGGDRVRVFLDGRLYRGDPTRLALADEQVVVVTFGTEAELPNPMPARFVYEGRPKPA
jgi:hypothetical protein